MAQQAPADIEHDFAGDLQPQTFRSLSPVIVLLTVYGKKPAQKQKDHREQLLANNKPVAKINGRRMVRR